MDEPAMAFDTPYPPTARDPLDRISVRDFVREVDIGAFRSERGVTQRVRFNVVLEVANGGALNDDVDKVLSYATIVETIDATLAAERLNLLETLAERVAAGCLADERALRVLVRVEKLDRIPGALGVEIVRTRPREAAPGPHPAASPAPRLRVEIRPLGSADRELWADLAHQLFREAPRDDLRAEIEDVAGIGLGATRAWAAYADGAAVGFAALGLRPYANGRDARPAPFLEAIWVAPQARRRGVGRALVEHLAALALAEGHRELGSDARFENARSHAAHAAWGFAETERVVCFRLAL